MIDDGRKSRGRRRESASFPAPVGKNVVPTDYQAVLERLKERIRAERLRVTMSANSAMVLLYWDIGKTILERQQERGWGARIIDRLSHDLNAVFPDMSGFSPRNLKYMRAFAEAWPDRAIVQRTVAQLPWRSNLALIEKLEHPEARLWYAQKTIENGWSRDILALQIESGCANARGAPSPTSPLRCLRPTLTWRRRYSKILTSLTFLAPPIRAANAKWSGHWWITSSVSYWKWVPASLSSDDTG